MKLSKKTFLKQLYCSYNIKLYSTIDDCKSLDLVDPGWVTVKSIIAFDRKVNTFTV